MNKTIKVFITGLLGGLFTISSFTAFGNSIALKNREKPVSIVTKSVKSKTEPIDINLKIPIIKGNSTPINKINTKFLKDANNFKAPLNKQAIKDFNASKKNKDIPFHTYQAYSRYKTHYNKNGLLSIAVRYYSYTGGANGVEYQTGYTSKLTSGKFLKLSELFEPGFDYVKVISDEVLKQMKQHKEIYFPEAITKFKSISKDQSYYIENDNLVVFYGPFEIAPHAYGIPEFKIPFSMLKFKNGLGL